MKHIGISVTLNDFEVPFFIGFFRITEFQDIRQSAAIACKMYGDDYFKKYQKQWTSRIKLVEVWKRDTMENLLTINL